MKSVESALKKSNKNEKTLTGGAQNGQDFSVDDLLDFSNEDDDVFVEEDETELKVQRKRSVSDENTLHRTIDFSTVGIPTSELSVPMDDEAELEWLSNFVEDSFAPCSAAPTKKPDWLTGNRRHPVPPPVNEETCFKSPPPVQIRPKRTRSGVTVSSHGLTSLTDSSSSSDTSSSSSSGASTPLWVSGSEFLDETMVKKQKKEVGQRQTQTQKKKVLKIVGQTRRCCHCGVQKTPQWRAGPSGAKTLCNACGVRYKSGRLLPEYRPVGSPTFSSELHSNHHRRVIEIRRKKETSKEGDKTG